MDQLNHAVLMRLNFRIGKTPKILISRNLPSSPLPEINPPAITRQIALKEYEKVKAEIKAIHKSRSSTSSSIFLSIGRKFACNLDSPSPDRYTPKYSFIKPTPPSLVILNSRKNTPRKKKEFIPKCVDHEHSECSYPSKYTQSKLDTDSSRAKIQPSTTLNLLNRHKTSMNNDSKEFKTTTNEQNISISNEKKSAIIHSPSVKGPDFSHSISDHSRVKSSLEFNPKNSEIVRSNTPDFSNQKTQENFRVKEYRTDTINYDKYLDACLKLKPRSNVSVPSLAKATARDDRFIFNRGYYGVSKSRCSR